MYLSFHGGFCCGVKHLFGFLTSPKTTITINHEFFKKYEDDCNKYSIHDWLINDLIGSLKKNKSGIKTNKDLLKFYIDYIGEGQCIEVCLIQYQKRRWKETLFEFGFKQITTFKNSNSKNTVYVYHLVT